MRKLASVQKIKELVPIKGADRIEKARIKGWWVVVRKGEFKINDKCVYFEIDSLLPLKPWSEFLTKGRSLKKSIVDGKEIEGFRLKTIRLQNTLSQGLALPLNIVGVDGTTPIETECSEQLGIHKYEPPIPIHLSGEVKGNFPIFIPKTDEERIQNIPEYIGQYRGKNFTVTEKVDGTSITIYQHEGNFGACSRNLELKENPDNAYWKIALPVKGNLREGLSIQGEIIGEGIQGNPLLLKGISLYVFYIYSIHTREYLSIEDISNECTKMGLKTVPIINTKYILPNTLQELLDSADGKSMLNQNRRREGLVYRLNTAGPKISFKAVSNNYLLGGKDG